MKPKKILSIYRGKMLEHRGTPIRVRSLLSEVSKDERIELSSASWDSEILFSDSHIQLTNSHFQDLVALFRFVKRERIEMVIGHTTSSSYYLVFLKFFTGVKTILEMHGLMEEESRAYGDMGALRYWGYKVWHSFFYTTCSLITTCSKSVTDIVARRCRNAISLTGGVDLGEFNPNTPVGTYLHRDNRIIIGYAGNTRIWQGLDFLATTFQKLVKEHSDFRLALLLSDRKGIDADDTIELYGPLPHEEVPKFLIDCDILVIPRPDTPVTRISFPSKIPEHLAMGRAVVAANTGDANQVIEQGVNGLLYTPGSEKELIEALLRLRDPALRKRLGEAAALSAEKLSWEKLGGQLIDNILKIS